jgi:hypothetical protein
VDAQDLARLPSGVETVLLVGDYDDDDSEASRLTLQRGK